MWRRMAERVGIEPTPRHKCRGDDFEDRDGHQARITLRLQSYLVFTLRLATKIHSSCGRAITQRFEPDLRYIVGVNMRVLY